jgi:high-affinity iron transporter
VLTADFVYTRANSAPPSARAIAAVGSEVRMPVSEVQDGKMHLFTINAGGQSLRFLIIKKPNGYGTALDACRICGAEGYRQDGQNVVCRHCGSAIYVPTIGEAGGCNPIGVPSHVDGSDLVLDLSSLVEATKEIPQ